jgi:nitrogen-specific signal transduction histidine kinase
MSFVKNFLISTKSLILIFLVIATISVTSVIIELKKSKEETLGLMEKQGHTLLESLLEASANALLSYDKIENELKQRLVNNGKLIKILYKKDLISDKILSDIARNNKIFRINIFSKSGQKLFSSHKESAIHKNVSEKFSPLEFIKPIFENSSDTLIIGLKSARYFSGRRFAVAVRIDNSTAVVLNVDANELLTFRKQVGFGVLLKNISKNKLIEYIVLQDDEGIIAGSGNLKHINNSSSSEQIKKSVTNNSYVWHIFKDGNYSAFEALHPFNYNGEMIGVFRLGLSVEPLNKLNERTSKRMIFLAIILSVFGIVTIVLIFLRQNFDLLNKKFSSVSSYAKTIFDNVSDAVFVIDSEQNIISMNPAADKLISSPVDGGKPIENLLSKVGCEKILSVDKNYFETECKINNEKRIFFVSKSKYKNSGQRFNIILILREITEQKNLEKQINRNEKLREISELASTVAHEIRNPLNAIGTITQQLGKDFIPKENKEDFYNLTSLVYHEVKRINEIIENFLKYSRPTPLKPEYFLLSDIFEQIQLQYKQILTDKNIHLLIQSNLNEKVFLDRNQITQVFINLIQNAIDSLNNGGEIKVDINKNEDKIDISVSDDGCGIPEEYLNKIFNLYFTTKPKGSGIGLSLVHKIISDHGGFINVNSAINQGTRFIITLPIKSGNN